jgi:SNF family Na+-dependent transporter
MINEEHSKIGFILSVITLINCIITCLISIIVLIRIISYACYNRMKLEHKITIILCIYIYFLVSIYVILLGSMNVYALLGDLYKYHFHSSWCIFRAYFITVVLNTLYCVCINQVKDE